MVPAAATSWVRAQLAAAPDGPLEVLHRGPLALYAAAPGPEHPWCVGIVSAHAAAVPNALRLARPGLAELATAELTLEAGVLHVSGRPLRITRVVSAAVPRLRPTRRPGEPGPDFVEERLGLGSGLTPEGDDFLAGWLAVYRAARVATPQTDRRIRAGAHRTTLLSATLLECASRGEVIPAFAAYLRAHGTPAEPAAAAVLSAVGHTSGAALLAGARRALADLSPAGSVGRTRVA